MAKASELWQSILEELEVLFNKTTVSTWFTQARAISLTKNELVIECPNFYTQEFIAQRYKKTIEKLLATRVHANLSLNLVVGNRIQSQVSGPLFDENPTPSNFSRQAGPEEKKGEQSKNLSHLSPGHTFDNFVVGTTNRVAHAAAMAVSQNPGQLYNPLFLYGGTGVGKTHLLHAIGNMIRQSGRQMQILYFTTEKLLNDFVESIQLKKEMQEFRSLYRNNDAILVDDVQFIGGKGALQEEFYHMFNQLYQDGKQIVLAADRLPKDIANLAERLVSRFMGGLLVDIGLPDYETRLAILTDKAARLNLSLDPKILGFIADHVEQNVRELEGVLLKIKSVAHAQEIEPNLGLVKDLLLGNRPLKPNLRLTPELILTLITENFDTAMRDLCGKRRRQEDVLPRQVAMYLLRMETGLNYAEIGQILGGRDHTTVLYGVQKIKTELEAGNPIVRTHIKTIRTHLYS